MTTEDFQEAMEAELIKDNKLDLHEYGLALKDYRKHENKYRDTAINNNGSGTDRR